MPPVLPLNRYIKLISPQTDLVGIGIPFSNSFPLVKELILFLKKCRPELKIVTGGVHASLFPESCLESGADYVITGEGEIPILELANGKAPSTIAGLISRELKNIDHTVNGKCIENLDEIPFPDYSDEDLN